MEHRILITLIFQAVMLLPAPNQAREWYEGGTLHNATVGEFGAASPQNRLATAGDWMAGMADSQLLHEQSQDSLREAADDIQECVAKVDSFDSQKAVTAAVLCMGFLKDKYPWLLTKDKNE